MPCLMCSEVATLFVETTYPASGFITYGCSEIGTTPCHFVSSLWPIFA